MGRNGCRFSRFPKPSMYQVLDNFFYESYWIDIMNVSSHTTKLKPSCQQIKDYWMQSNNADGDYVVINPNHTLYKDGSSEKQQIKESGIHCMGSTVWIELPLFLIPKTKHHAANAWFFLPSCKATEYTFWMCLVTQQNWSQAVNKSKTIGCRDIMQMWIM
jgi:hypothetical protein